MRGGDIKGKNITQSHVSFTCMTLLLVLLLSSTCLLVIVRRLKLRKSKNILLKYNSVRQDSTANGFTGSGVVYLLLGIYGFFVLMYYYVQNYWVSF